MEKDSILFAQQFFGKKKMEEKIKNKNKDMNVNIHKDCILQIDILQNKSKEKDNQIYILNKKYKILENVNTELKNQVDNLTINYNDLKQELKEMKDWKNNHKCSGNINIDELDVNEIPKYIELKNINDKYSKIIIQLEDDIKDIKLNSNIEDNILFKQLKQQNDILRSDNKKRSNSIENNDNYIDINLKINDALDKQKEILSQEYKNNYSSNILSLSESIKCLQQTIDDQNKKNEELQKQLDEIKINNKKLKDNKTKNNYVIDKYSEQSLFNSIYIYDNVNLPYQKYIASKTYRKLLEEIEFNNTIGDGLKYEDITNWINKNEKSKFKSCYFKNKYERSKLILELYKHDLYKINNLKFSLSFISNMSEQKFKDWLFILDSKINEFYIPNNKFIKCTNEECDNCDRRIITKSSQNECSVY